MLVDDVVTSASTARECAKALLGAGAQEVGIVSFAGEM
jgi:predicted amidophosphoribosyltransferase